MMSNAPNASGLSGISQPPAIAASTRPVAEVAERLAERHRARRARVRGREDRAADAERDAEVGRAPRRRTPRARGSAPPAGCRARGTARAAPPRRRCRPAPSRGRCRSAPGRRRRRLPGASRASSSASRPATSPNWLNRSSWRAVLGGIHGERVEVVDLGGDLRAERARVEAVDPRHRRPAAPEAGPERVDARSRRRVMTPIPVIQTRRRSCHRGSVGAATSLGSAVRAASALATASAIALNVASVRPAIGRVNSRSTNGASPGSRGAKSCSIETWQPVAVGLDAPGHVHAARRAGRRGRSAGASASGSDQVRARHATGRPRPRTGTSGRRATKSTTQRAVGRRSRARRAGVVGEQRSPALDVAGEPEHELGRRVDVDRRSCSRIMVVMAPAARRGSAGRARGRPATRSPITRPIVARTPSRAATRRAAYSNSAGRARNAWTSHETASLARNRRRIARS